MQSIAAAKLGRFRQQSKHLNGVPVGPPGGGLDATGLQGPGDAGERLDAVRLNIPDQRAQVVVCLSGIG
jgi:hypothetical protein